MKRRHFLSLLPATASVLLERTASGYEFPKFSADIKPGALCEVEVARLRPTQFALGMREVRMRLEKIRTKSAAKLDKYLGEHVVPVVIAPGGIPYATDHHHFCRAILDSGLRPTVYALVKANYSRLNEGEFWAHMDDKHWLHLFDEQGQGPLDRTLLPLSMADMKDDRYRSLAWAVRNGGGYGEVDDIYFVDFMWADFFRKRIKFEDTDEGFAKATVTALKLAHRLDASDLPGYGLKDWDLN